MNLVITIIIIGAYAMQGAEAVFLLPVLRELGLTWNPYDYEGNLIHQARHEDLDPIPPGLIGCIDRVALLAEASARAQRRGFGPSTTLRLRPEHNAEASARAQR